MAWAWRASCSTPNNSARKGGSLARVRKCLCLAKDVSERSKLVSICNDSSITSGDIKIYFV